MKDEIKRRHDEISESFCYVYWEWEDNSYGEFNNMGGSRFEYKNGIEKFQNWKNDQ